MFHTLPTNAFQALELKEKIQDTKHKFTSNMLENALLEADENMVRPRTPPPVNNEPAWKARGRELMRRYDREQARKNVKDKKSRGKSYDKKGLGKNYVLAVTGGDLNRKPTIRLPSVDVRNL